MHTALVNNSSTVGIKKNRQNSCCQIIFKLSKLLTHKFYSLHLMNKLYCIVTVYEILFPQIEKLVDKQTFLRYKRLQFERGWLILLLSCFIYSHVELGSFYFAHCSDVCKKFH